MFLKGYLLEAKTAPKKLVVFFNFLWNASPDRITRKVAIKNLSLGGLRMPHIYSFIKALKISWLRRVIQQVVRFCSVVSYEKTEK